MSAPLVSVCIPTRDRAGWLGEALTSVYAQTMQDFEVVIADDGSRDDTGTLVARHADRRLRYLRHPRPLGVAATRNACLQAARGRYLAWLDSDDRYLPDFLATQCAVLDREPRAGLVHGAFEVIDVDGRPRRPWPAPFARDTVERGRDAFAELLLRDYIGAPTVVVRRDIYQQVGVYDTSLQSAEDWDMWLRIALHADLAYVARPLAQYRWHPRSLSRSAASSGRRLSIDRRAVDGVLRRNRGRLPAELGTRAHAALAARALRAATDGLTRGSWSSAWRGLLLALRVWPRMARDGGARLLASAILRRDEYGWHVASRDALRRLAAVLAGSRFGDALARSLTADPAWENALREIARTLRSVVPAGARVAALDKWDPTLLHLAGRRGCHFPDRRWLADGYPTDDETAWHHLEELRKRGVSFVVIPSSAFWWLEHYPAFARRLETEGQSAWRDERCLIYELPRRSAA